MKSIRFRLLIAALAVVMGSVVAKSQTADATTAPPMHHHEFARHGERIGFFSQKLNLTDDQKTQMKTIMQKEHPAMKPLFQQERELDLQLRQYAEGNFDAAKVQAIAAQKAQIQIQLTVAQTRIHNKMYQVLTADQQAQLKQMEADHQARMQERMQQHMKDAPPASPEQ